MRTKKFTKLPETHPLEKDRRIGISGVPGQGRASRYGPLREIRFPLPGSARPRWCHGGWDPRKTPERRRGFSQSGSPDGLLNWSSDGWFSCSKTTDSGRSQGEANRTFKCSGKKTNWDSSLFGFGSLDVLQKPSKTESGSFWSVKIQWLAWTQQNQLGKRICCSTKHLFRFLDVFTYQTLDVSIASNWRTWHLIVSSLIGFFSS